MNKHKLESIFDVLRGQKLGQGAFRKVYALQHTPDLVLKVARKDGVESNVLEYVVWSQFKETKEGRRWLARVASISYDGACLMQERLTPFADAKDRRLPKQIPQCFTDTKAQNWGYDAKGKAKCCDYGTILLLQEDPWKLVDAEWWG